MIYHKAHTWTYGSFAHGEHDSESISCMFCYAPRMSQALKDHIWAQLSLGYIAKQIYDKHKTIWCERVNADQSMTQDDFIWLQDITYLDRKHKKGSWQIYTLTLQFQLGLGLFNIRKMCSFSKMLVKSMRFKSHSPYVFKYQLNVSPCYHMVTIVPFLWMPCLAQMTWNSIYSPWWGLMIITRVSF